MTSGLFGESTDFVVGDSSNVSIQHAFTDAGAEAARNGAVKHCGYKKKVAVKTSGACTMKTCTSHYQCMDPKDAEAFQSGQQKK